MFMKTTGRPSKKGTKNGVHAGRWTREEHEKFLTALNLFGREWRKVADYIKSRTSAQIRSHAQKYFAKLEKEAAAGIHGGVEEVHGSHVALLSSVAGGKRRSRASGSKRTSAGSRKRRRNTAAAKTSRKKARGKASAASSKSRDATKAPKPGAEPFKPISLQLAARPGSTSPNSLTGDRGSGTLSPRTTRINTAMHCHPVVRKWSAIEDSIMENMENLKHVTETGSAETVPARTLALEANICRNHAQAAELPCMCRRMCLIVQCGKRRVTARAKGDLSNLLCLTVQRNLLNLINTVTPTTPNLASLLAAEPQLRQEIHAAEAAGDSISFQESAQLFHSLSQEAQNTLEKLNETELTAVQVLIGTSIGLKPRKSPLRLSSKWTNARPPEESVLPIRS